jgi:hypothetical protein
MKYLIPTVFALTLLTCQAENLKLVCQVSGKVTSTKYEESLPLTPVSVDVEGNKKHTSISVTGPSSFSMFASSYAELENRFDENEIFVIDFLELKTYKTFESKIIKINRITGTIEASSIREVQLPNGQKDLRFTEFKGTCSKATAKKF